MSWLSKIGINAAEAAEAQAARQAKKRIRNTVGQEALEVLYGDESDLLGPPREHDFLNVMPGWAASEEELADNLWYQELLEARRSADEEYATYQRDRMDELALQAIGNPRVRSRRKATSDRAHARLEPALQEHQRLLEGDVRGVERWPAYERLNPRSQVYSGVPEEDIELVRAQRSFGGHALPTPGLEELFAGEIGHPDYESARPVFGPVDLWDAGSLGVALSRGLGKKAMSNLSKISPLGKRSLGLLAMPFTMGGHNEGREMDPETGRWKHSVRKEVLPEGWVEYSDWKRAMNNGQ